MSVRFCAILAIGLLEGREGLASCLSLFGAIWDIGLLDTWVRFLETPSDSWKVGIFVWNLVWNYRGIVRKEYIPSARTSLEMLS